MTRESSTDDKPNIDIKVTGMSDKECTALIRAVGEFIDDWLESKALGAPLPRRVTH